MENKLIAALLAGLIAAVVFHAFATRYQMVAVAGHAAYRIDRLTGKTSFCMPENPRIECWKERE